MKRIGIKYNEKKVKIEKVEELAAWLERGGRSVTPVSGKRSPIPPDLDLLIVMGGDGTLLGGARAAAAFGIPVIGIDFGGLGFLSEIKYSEAKSSLNKIFKGEFSIEERLMLEAIIRHDGRDSKPLVAVNDIVVTKQSGRLLRLKVFINKTYFHEFPGDGMIISSSTGSTAYALSAGGPIVSPELDIISLTPICPHTLFARAIITSGADIIRVELPPARDDLYLIVDGQEEVHLHPKDTITLKSAPMRVRLIRVTEPHFYQRVREKFNLA
jgi:NAD+ kinase